MDIKLPISSCTGCGSCLQICSRHAISMDYYRDGFLYPTIDNDKCIECGLCLKSCHSLNDKMFNEVSECFAAQNKDANILSLSTSGGIFYSLAISVLNNNGIVYGCAFDEDYNASIVRAKTIEEIIPFFGSKYVWSDSSNSYRSVKNDLDNGYEVLYTCLPCQAAGLKMYLGKTYEKLFIVDVLCGGAPSPYAFQKYLETITDNFGKKDLNFKFRDKEGFGTGVNCTYSHKGKKYHENWLENSYYFAFSSKSRITWRISCYGCNYKSVHRVSDMTIGDYWGVEKYHPDFQQREGVSVILINSNNGRTIFDRIKDNLLYENSNVVFATEKNSLVNEIIDGHVQIPENRNAFFEELHNKGWSFVDKKYLNLRKKMLFNQKRRKIKNYIFRKLKFIR